MSAFWDHARAGASVLPLPPYSSDYDPIEELWSKFKGELRRVAARVRNDLYNARLLTDLHQIITRLDVVFVWLGVAPCRV